MTSTYTYVRYWNKEDLAEVMAKVREFEEELEERRPHMEAKAYRAAKRRLEMLRNAAELMTEPVPRPYGG